MAVEYNHVLTAKSNNVNRLLVNSPHKGNASGTAEGIGDPTGTTLQRSQRSPQRGKIPARKIGLALAASPLNIRKLNCQPNFDISSEGYLRNKHRSFTNEYATRSASSRSPILADQNRQPRPSRFRIKIPPRQRHLPLPPPYLIGRKRSIPG